MDPLGVLPRALRMDAGGDLGTLKGPACTRLDGPARLTCAADLSLISAVIVSRLKGFAMNRPRRRRRLEGSE